MSEPVKIAYEVVREWLRPSNLGRLNLCIHHRPDGLAGDSLAVQRGNKIHPWIKRIVNGEAMGGWTREEIQDVAGAEWTAINVLQFLEKVEFEKPLELWDMFSVPTALIMKGTCDIFGYNKEDECLEIWDIKTGRYRDYSLQLMSYALMAMDLTGEIEARIRVAFCDEKLFQESVVSRGDCEEKVFGVLERIRIGVELPAENEYCGQCRRQSVCEVWTKPSELALTIMDIDTEPLADLSPALDQTLAVKSRLELIKDDPKMLGRFLDAWRKANTLVEKVGLEDRAKELLLADPNAVPGWKAVEYQGRRFYDKTQIETILNEWGPEAADFLAINKERYEGACSNSDNEIIEPAGRAQPYYKLLRKK